MKYTGKLVRIALYHQDITEDPNSSGGYHHYESTGWYIDDIELYTAKTIPIYLKQGFNLVSIPAGVTSQPDLRDWLPVLGDSSEIEKVMVYNDEAGKFITLIPGETSNPGFILQGAKGSLFTLSKIRKSCLVSSCVLLMISNPDSTWSGFPALCTVTPPTNS